MRVPKLDPACVLLALAGAAALFLLAGTDPYWSDWGSHDGYWVAKLMDGDAAAFFDNAVPSYMGSLVARLPIFLSVALFGGSEDQAFYAAKAVALLILAGLAAYLMTRAKAAGATRGALLLIALVLAANPIAGRALDYGHAEDLMAAAAAIAGVLLASRGRITWAAVVIGVGIALKQWAILAALPAAAAAPRHGWRIPLIAGPLALLFWLPLLFRGGGVAGVAEGAQLTSFDIWRAQQVFWPLGIDNPNPGKLGLPRISPEWFLPVPRMIIVGMSAPLSYLWWRHRRAGGGHRHDVLLLLALLFLGRCFFEPWNIDYYHTPFVLTLGVWEVLRRPGIPVLTLAATAATWLSFEGLPVDWYNDLTYALYMGWTVPLAAVLLRALLRRPQPAGAGSRSLAPTPA